MDNRYTPPMAAAVGAPMDQARAAFEWLTRGPRPVTVDGRAVRGMPARAIPLDTLRDRLTHPSCPAATRDAAWAYLVRRARAHGGLWTVACVGTALPALTTTSARLCRHLRPGRTRGGAGPWGRAGVAGAVADVESAVLSGFLTELAGVDLRRPKILARLCSAAHEAGTLARREIQRAPMPRAALFTSCPPAAPARHPDLVLARAVTAGALSRAEAALIGSTRLEPISVADVAQARGRTVRATHAARRRAERKLAAFLRDIDPGDSLTQLTSTRTVDADNGRRSRHASRRRPATSWREPTATPRHELTTTHQPTSPAGDPDPTTASPDRAPGEQRELIAQCENTPARTRRRRVRGRPRELGRIVAPPPAADTRPAPGPAS